MSWNQNYEALHLKDVIAEKLKESVTKLTYIYEIQDRDFWYLNVAKLNKKDIDHTNIEFTKRIGDDFIELGLTLGNFFNKNNELTIELYKFNETLTRLLNKSNQSHRTIFEESSGSSSAKSLHATGQFIISQHSLTNRLDSNLIIKTFVKTLITKLEQLNEKIISSMKPITTVETKLIDDVLVKNISHRILQPYHNLLISRIQSNLSELL